MKDRKTHNSSEDINVFSLSLDNLPGEKWVDAWGFDGIFQVSNKGRVKSLGRLVSNGKSERWVKERIRKLYVNKDKRVSMMFNVEGVRTSINMQAMVFFSFNPDKNYFDKTYCIAHKNKIASDNSLDNLILIKTSESHKINHSKNLLPHLKENNDRAKEAYKKLTDKVCKVCSLKKDIKLFEHGRNTCIKCRKEQKAETFRKSKNT